MTSDAGHPRPVSDSVRKRMQKQARKDTVPEVELRRELHRRGLRFRVGYRVPGNARRSIDIAFPGRRLAIFVDGCFWHRCPTHSVPAKHNGSWWDRKLAENQRRDRETTQLLEHRGWRVIRIWEHEDPELAADRVEEALHS